MQGTESDSKDQWETNTNGRCDRWIKQDQRKTNKRQKRLTTDKSQRRRTNGQKKGLTNNGQKTEAVNLIEIAKKMQ